MFFFSNSFYTTLVDCSSSPVASVDGNNERQKIHLAQNLSAGLLGTFVLEEEGNGFPPNRRSFKSLDSFSRSHPLSLSRCCCFEASCRILVSLKTFFFQLINWSFIDHSGCNCCGEALGLGRVCAICDCNSNVRHTELARYWVSTTYHIWQTFQIAFQTYLWPHIYRPQW